MKKKKPVAVVKVFEGAVLTKSPHGSLKQISAKSLPLTLFSGDTLVTHDGRVEIRYLTNQSTLRILENSKIRIWDEKARRGRVFREILTQFGHVWARIEQDKKIQNNFVTPVAMAGIRNTEFELTVNRTSGASRFSVNQGRMKINADDRTIVLSSGQFSKVLPGKPPSKPKRFKPKPAPLVPKPAAPSKAEEKSWWQYLWPFD